MDKPREVMLCVEKDRDKDGNGGKIYRIAKITYATPMDQWVLAMPYKNRTVTVVSLPPQVIDRALAMGCKRWVVRFEPAMICLSFPLDHVKSKGWYKKAGGHFEYFVKLDKFVPTVWQNWAFTDQEEIVPWTIQEPITEEAELPDLDDGPSIMSAEEKKNAVPAPVVATTPTPTPTPKAPDVPVTTAPVTGSARLIEEPLTPRPHPAVARPGGKLQMRQVVETVYPDEPKAPAPAITPQLGNTPPDFAYVAMALEQAIGLITSNKVGLSIMRSADHPVMGEMWIGVFKIAPNSGYGDHLFPIIGGSPIEVAVTAAYTLGDRKAAGR